MQAAPISCSYPSRWQQTLPLLGYAGIAGFTTHLVVSVVRRVLGVTNSSRPIVWSGLGVVGMVITSMRLEVYITRQVADALKKYVQDMMGPQSQREAVLGDKEQLLQRLVAIDRGFYESLRQLPANMVHYVADVLRAVDQGEIYSESGFATAR